MFTAQLLEIYSNKKTAESSLKELFTSRQTFMRKMAIPIYEN
jgi:hypothetical protein